jgi:hypothetical protein
VNERAKMMSPDRAPAPQQHAIAGLAAHDKSRLGDFRENEGRDRCLAGRFRAWHIRDEVVIGPPGISFERPAPVPMRAAARHIA